MRIAGPPTHAIRAPADNPRLEAIYAADQADRSGPTNTIDLARMRSRDIPRRAEVGGLVARDALHTANDFYRAAMVFQHGPAVEHIRTAHRLASKGDERDPQRGALVVRRELRSHLCLRKQTATLWHTVHAGQGDRSVVSFIRSTRRRPTPSAPWGVPSLAAARKGRQDEPRLRSSGRH